MSAPDKKVTPEDEDAIRKKEERKLKMLQKFKKDKEKEKENSVRKEKEIEELKATLLSCQEIKEKILFINKETNPVEIHKLYDEELQKNEELCAKLKNHLQAFPDSEIQERRAPLIAMRSIALKKGLTIDTITKHLKDLEENECFEIFYYCCLFWKYGIYPRKTEENGTGLENNWVTSNEHKRKIFADFKKNFFYDNIAYLQSLEDEMDGKSTVVVRKEPKKEPKKIVFVDEEALKFKPIVFNPEEVINFDDLKDNVDTHKFKLFDQSKTPLVMIFIGHVDHGKSTLCGSILRIYGTVSDLEFNKIKEEAKSLAMESWDLSQITDVIDEEKQAGKTLETARAYFETKTKRFTILDCPGHNKLVQAMIDGASQADVASLIVSAKLGEFESGFLKGGQTREHAMLARTLGASHIVVVVNKMDTVNWSKQRFEYIKKELEPFIISNCGFPKSNIAWVIISGYHQLNLHTRLAPDIAPWYQGKSLFEIYDDIPAVVRPNLPILRIPLLDKIKDMGAILAPCKINSGIVKPNMSCVLMPYQKPCVIAKVCDTADVELGFACAGDSVTLHLKGIEEEEIRRGFVICGQQYWITPAFEFEAEVEIFELSSNQIFGNGFTCMMHIHTALEEVTVLGIFVMDGTGPTAKRVKAHALKSKAVGFVRFSSRNMICMERFKDVEDLGRFTLRKETTTLGFGKVIRFKPANPELLKKNNFFVSEEALKKAKAEEEPQKDKEVETIQEVKQPKKYIERQFEEGEDI